MNQDKNTMFMRLHPIVNFVYFLVMMLFTMFYVNPILLGIAGVTTFVYLGYLGGRKQVKWNAAMIPFIVLLSMISPLFNRNGKTVLFYLFQKPVTWEAVVYGIFAAIMIYDMILLFRIFHLIMSSDKINCICSKLLPVGAILFTMTLRFVPMYKAQIHKIRIAQKGIGRDYTQGSLLERAKHGIELISGLFTWALENALETSDSMKGRGFGLQGRTYYTNTKFTKMDWSILGFELICAVVLCYGAGLHTFQTTYFPIMEWNWNGTRDFFSYGVFFLFASFPILLDWREEVIWYYLKQKI